MHWLGLKPVMTLVLFIVTLCCLSYRNINSYSNTFSSADRHQHTPALLNHSFIVCVCVCVLQIRAGEAAAIISRELSEQTKGHMHAGDITYTVRAMGHLIDLLDVQLRNLTPGGKDSAARSLNKVLRLTYSTIIYVKSNV